MEKIKQRYLSFLMVCGGVHQGDSSYHEFCENCVADEKQYAMRIYFTLKFVVETVRTIFIRFTCCVVYLFVTTLPPAAMLD